MKNSSFKSAGRNGQFRLLLKCGTALPLAALATTAHAQSIQQVSDGDISVTADTATGTPVAVELESTGGSVSANVTTVTATSQQGDRDYVVGLQTDTDGAITGDFGSITATGDGEVLGLGAQSNNGNITLNVDSLDVDGTSSAGIYAASVNGDVDITVGSALSRGTGQDSQYEYYEAVYGASQTGSVAVHAGSAETYGTYGSAIGVSAGADASIDADSATIHSENTIGAYAYAGGDASVAIGTVSSTAETGQGIYMQTGGNATLAVDTIDMGDMSEGARINATGDVDAQVGTLTGGTGIYARSSQGDIALDLGTVDTFGNAVDVDAATGNVSVTAGTLSSSIDSATTLLAAAHGDGSVSLDVDSASGAGADLRTVSVSTESGDITINAGSISASGDSGQALYAHSTDGNVSVTADNIATTGGYMDSAPDFAEGVYAVSDNGTVDLAIGSASTEGFAASAVIGVSGAGTTIAVDDARSAGDQAAAVYAYSTQGAVDVDAGTVTTAGNMQAGIQAIAQGGAATVNVDTLANAGTDNLGVLAQGTGGAFVTAGDVSADVYGIRAVGLNGSDASISTTGNTSVTAGYGLRGQGYDVDISTAEGSLTEGNRDTIWAQAGNDATVTNLGTVRTTAYGSAIRVDAGGAATVVSTNAEVYGPGYDPGVGPDGMRVPQGGITVMAGGPVSIDAGTVTVDGEYNYGIYASTSGPITINADEVTLSSADSLAISAHGDTGDVSITTGTVTTTGTSDGGVYATTSSGDISIDAGTTRVEASGMQGNYTGDAVVAISQSGNVHVTSADAYSAGLYGSAVAAVGGTATVDSTMAETTGDGGVAVYAVGYQGDAVINADQILTSGDNSQAAFAQANSADATINVNTITATGDGADGAWARAYNGTATVNTTGDISASGGRAVVAQGGAVAVNIGADSTASGVIGVDASGSTDVAIDNAGTVSGESFGIRATSTAGNVDVVSNVATASADGVIDAQTGMLTQQGGIAINASAPNGNVTVDAATLVADGVGGRGLVAMTGTGHLDLTLGDVSAMGTAGIGVVAQVNGPGSAMTTVNGTITSGGTGSVTQALMGQGQTVINGTVTSQSGAGVLMIAQQGLVEIADGASTSGIAGVALFGGVQGGIVSLHNAGTIEGVNVGVTGGTINPNFPVADYYIYNDGTITGDSGLAVQTGAGGDVLELTENSVVNGIADLGAGYDILALGLNDDTTSGTGYVAETRNVEHLSVSSGDWIADVGHSSYESVAIDEGSSLTIGQVDGFSTIDTGYVENNGTLALNFDTDTEAGDLDNLLIEGTGSLHLVGPATVLVDNASGLQYTGGTFVDAGTLELTTAFGGDVTTSGTGVFQLDNGGDLTGNLVNDGTFVYNRDDSYDYAGDFSGSGSLVKNGDGRLTFAGLYDFAGTTQINAGAIGVTGALSADTEISLSGDGVFDLSQVSGGEQTIAELSGTGGSLILGTTDLVINQDTDTVFGGSISGTGTLVKDGDGDLKLNGDGTFSGDAVVDGGILSVNGSYADATFYVNEGGTLGGNGTVGDTFVEGGTLGAGNSIGQLTVAGDLSFTADSILQVEVDEAGNADRVDVTGMASLGDATVQVLAANGTYQPVTDYTILTAAGGIDGTFGNVTTNLAFLVPTLNYTADTVTLRLERNNVAFSGYATGANGMAVGGLIENLGYGSTLYNEALYLSTAQAPTAFDSLTGEVYPAYTASLVETADFLRRETMQPKAVGAGPFVWATGLAGTINSGAGGYSAYKAKNTGVAGGIGFGAIGFDVTAGIGKLKQDPSRGQITDSDVTFALLQGTYESPVGFSVRAGVQFGWVDANASRAVQLNTLSGTAKSDFKAKYTMIYGEAGYALPLPGVKVEPYVGLSHVSLNVDKIEETGGPLALTVSNLDRDVTFGDLGVRVEAPTVGPVTGYASAAFRHAWGDLDSRGDIAFAGNTTTGLIGAVPVAKSAAELTAGLRYSAGNFGIGVGYTGSYSKTFDDSTFSVTASFRF